jgi:hypothetical protein
MTEHKLEINEGAEAVDRAGAPEASPRKLYRVTDKVVREATDESNGSDGLFKNGKVYAPGETIELDEKTAAGFLALGEIEEVAPGEQSADEEVAKPQPGDVVQPNGEGAPDA